jgi:phosphatidyl-myo-inositol alpha-mannosyltransferase
LRAPVDFVGHVSTAEKVRLLQEAHLAIAPSAKEGFGLSLVEAAACRTPVVASRVQGHRDALPRGAKLEFANGNSAACATAALRLLSNPALVENVGTKALRRVKRLDWRSSVLGIRQAALEATRVEGHASAAMPRRTRYAEVAP